MYDPPLPAQPSNTNRGGVVEVPMKPETSTEIKNDQEKW